MAVLASTSACTSRLGRPEYETSIPTLSSRPLMGTCHLDGDNLPPVTCILLNKADYDAIVMELKAECLALGNDEKTCEVKGNAETR